MWWKNTWIEGTSGSHWWFLRVRLKEFNRIFLTECYIFNPCRHAEASLHAFSVRPQWDGVILFELLCTIWASGHAPSLLKRCLCRSQSTDVRMLDQGLSNSREPQFNTKSQYFKSQRLICIHLQFLPNSTPVSRSRCSQERCLHASCVNC